MTGDLPANVAHSGDRFEWVDVARGIGIVAVAAGHVWTSGPLRDALYSFHMPLFFLLSGYLSRPRPTAAFARAQATTQGTTYLVYLLLLVLSDIAIEQAREHRPIFSHWPADLWSILIGGSALKGPFTVFWFVPCLLAARITFNSLCGFFPDPLSRWWLVMAAISFATALPIGSVTDYSPLGLLSLPMALFLLWAGSAGRTIGWRDWFLWPLIPLALAGLLFFPPVNMKAGDYGWPLLSLAGALATSALIFRVARWPLPGANALRALGRGSLVIMYLHVPVAHYLAPHLGKPIIFGLALTGPYVAYRMFRLTRPTARLFLAQT